MAFVSFVKALFGISRCRICFRQELRFHRRGSYQACGCTRLEPRTKDAAYEGVIYCLWGRVFVLASHTGWQALQVYIYVFLVVLFFV